MEEVIKRLRASKSESDAKYQSEGVEAGKSWATGDAEYRELVRLEKFWNELERDSWGVDGWFGSPLWQTSFSHVQTLAGVILHDSREEWDQSRLNEFWVRYAGCEDPLDEFAKGFCRGALEFWSANKYAVNSSTS